MGVIVGSYIKHHVGDANAASENITVTNNNQVSTMDQGAQVMVRTSTVTVKDTTATLGYTLSARVENNSIPNSTIKLGSSDSTICTLSNPCTITSDVTPTTILETADTGATGSQGHTTYWGVTVTFPGTAPEGNYIIDIAYGEDPILPPPGLADGSSMQDVTAEICEQTPMGMTVNLVDTRDGKTYKVRKMADSRCWMIDNLAYDINSAPAIGKPAYATTPEYDSTPTGTPNLSSVNTKPQYAMNTTAYNIPNNGTSTPSYLYNWCAAMGDTSANCATTVGYTARQPATPQTGICPAPFRLPMTGATPSPSTPGNGSNQATAAATTTNEFAKLDIWMGGTGANRTGANTYTNFTTDGATNPQFFWLGVLGGYYSSGLVVQGIYGYWWSSTAGSGTNAYRLYLSSGTAYVSPSNLGSKSYGYAVRCIL